MKTEITEILNQTRKELQSNATEEKQISIARFFKHNIRCHGVSNPHTQAIGRRIIQNIKKENKSFAFDLAEAFFSTGFLEEALLACQIVFARKKDFVESDFELFEKWVNLFIRNWAVCDTFCNQSVGHLIMQNPSLVKKIIHWTSSENLWVRRACAVSFIYPAKRELFIEEQLEIALLLLEDKEDMVQKGYGWMLKVLSQKKLILVFQFVNQYKARMPRTALRYAIEKMPKNLKDEAMN